MGTVSRRHLLATSLGLASAAPLGLAAREAPPARTRLKVVFVGAHPDDVETCAGATVARYAERGHDVAILYLTKGEVGMRGKSKEETAAIRSAEAERAAEILKARVRFLGRQVDGSTEVHPARYDEFRQSLEEEKPDLVFTWWPINSHRDHRAVFSLVHDAWLRSKKRFALFYFENTDTQHFWPTHYVDVSDLQARKKAACFSHTWYKDRPDLDLWASVEVLLRARGLQAGCRYAEAFVAQSMNRAPGTGAPGLGE